MSSLIRTVASAEPKVSAAMTAPTTAIARISLPLPHSMSLYGNLTSRIFFGENFPVGTCGYLTRVDIFPRRAREGIRKKPNPTARRLPDERGCRHSADRTGDRARGGAGRRDRPRGRA